MRHLLSCSEDGVEIGRHALHRGFADRVIEESEEGFYYRLDESRFQFLGVLAVCRGWRAGRCVEKET